MSKRRNGSITVTKSGASAMTYAAALAAASIWGGSFPATKLSVMEAAPIVVILLRTAICLPLLCLNAKRQGALRLPTKKELLPIAFMGFQGFYFHQTIQSYAMRTAGAANGNWLMVATPAMVAVLGRIFLKEKLSRRGIAGLVVSTAGVALVLAFGTVKSEVFSGFGSIGDIVLVASVLNWAVFLTLSRNFLSDDLHPAFLLFWELSFAFFYAAIFMPLFDVQLTEIFTYGLKTWLAILFLGAMSSAAAYSLWFSALSELPVSHVAIFQFIQPLVGAVISYFVVGERFTLWLFVGGALIIAGVMLVNKK